MRLWDRSFLFVSVPLMPSQMLFDGTPLGDACDVLRRCPRLTDVSFLPSSDIGASSERAERRAAGRTRCLNKDMVSGLPVTHARLVAPRRRRRSDESYFL